MIRALFQTYTARHLHEVTHGFVLVLDFLLIGKRGGEEEREIGEGEEEEEMEEEVQEEIRASL